MNLSGRMCSEDQGILLSRVREAMKFAVVGVMNTALDISIYFILTRLLGFDSRVVLAKAISYGAGIGNSYLWNKRWTFKVRNVAAGAFIIFVVANLLALLINSGAMLLCVKVLRLSELLSLAVATLIAFMWNFIISRYLVFKPPKPNVF